MSRVKLSINEKNVFLFSHNVSKSPIAVDSDSGFISKRVPGIRPVARSRIAGHQTLIEILPSGTPEPLAMQRCSRVDPYARMGPTVARRSAGIYPADHKHVSNRLRKPLMSSVRQLQSLALRIAI